MDAFLEQVKADAEYKRLLALCAVAEDDYEKLAKTWNAEHRQTVEKYLSACEELDHRMLVLALEEREERQIKVVRGKERL